MLNHIFILISLVALINTFDLQDLLDPYSLDLSYTFGTGEQSIKLYKANSFDDWELPYPQSGISLNILYTVGTDPTYQGIVIGSVGIEV
jgi:hypothetical protein